MDTLLENQNFWFGVYGRSLLFDVGTWRGGTEYFQKITSELSAGKQERVDSSGDLQKRQGSDPRGNRTSVTHQLSH